MNTSDQPILARPRRPGPRQTALRRRYTAAAATTATGIVAPAPGAAVLACRCGQVLALTDMHRPDLRPEHTSGPTIEPIRCRHCATA